MSHGSLGKFFPLIDHRPVVSTEEKVEEVSRPSLIGRVVVEEEKGVIIAHDASEATTGTKETEVSQGKKKKKIGPVKSTRRTPLPLPLHDN